MANVGNWLPSSCFPPGSPEPSPRALAEASSPDGRPPDELANDAGGREPGSAAELDELPPKPCSNVPGGVPTEARSSTLAWPFAPLPVRPGRGKAPGSREGDSRRPSAWAENLAAAPGDAPRDVAAS